MHRKEAKNNRKVAVSASLICSDLCNLEKSVRELEEAGVDFLHIDLIDAHFSPSMPMGIEVVQQLRKITDLPFDVHLMVHNNEFFIAEMAKLGVQRLCFHYESALHVDRLLNSIKSFNIAAGIALLPTTPLSVLDYCLDRLDYILLMLINPGFAGHADESQVPYAERRIGDCEKYLRNHGVNLPIEIDGRVSFDGMPALIAAGASIIVGGSSCLFHKSARVAENMKKTQQAISAGLERKGLSST